MPNNEAGRLASHVLLDTVSVWSDDATEAENTQVLDLAISRMNEIGCVVATYDDETDAVTVDYSDLAGGTLVLLQTLVQRIANLAGLDREVVINQHRELVDKSF